jgi:hypothetical protein
MLDDGSSVADLNWFWCVGGGSLTCGQAAISSLPAIASTQVVPALP